MVASLVILLSRAGVPQIFKILGPEARVVATKALGIRAMVVIMTVVGPMPWMPMSSKGVQLISLKVINQSHLVLMSNELMRLSKKISSGTAPCKLL